MKKYSLLILLAALITILCSCGNKNSSADKALDLSDRLMSESKPDSALRIIQAIDTTGLSERLKARHALLLTKALDKNDSVPDNTSLILKAVNFYQGNGSSEEMQSLYYYGNILYIKEYRNSTTATSSEAIAIMHLSHDLAITLNDKLYQGLSARILADLYRNIYRYNDELEYCLKAKKAHLEYDSLCNRKFMGYGPWMDIMLAEAYNDLNMPEKSLEISNKPDTSWYNNDDFFRHETLLNQIHSYHKLKKYPEAIDRVQQLMDDGYKMSGYDWCIASQIYFEDGQKRDALAYLDSAKIVCSDIYTQGYIDFIEGFYFASVKDFRNAYRYARDWEEVSQSIYRAILNSPKLQSVVHLYKSQVETKRLESQLLRRKISFWATTAVFLFIISLLVYYFYKTKIKFKRIEIEKLKLEQLELKNKGNRLKLQLDSLVNECCLLEENLRLKSESQEKLREGITKYLSNKVQQLEEAYINSIKNRAHDRYNPDCMPENKLIIKNIEETDFYDNLDYLIDTYSNGRMNEIIKSYPMLKQRQIRLIRYMYVGFSNEIITALLGMPSQNAFRVEKHKIKRIITDNPNSNTQKILDRLKMN